MILYSIFKKYALLPAVVLSALVLVGCQTPRAEPLPSLLTDEAKAERLATLRALNNFQFGGGLGIWTDTESISARIQWLQSDDNLDLKLTGPLGFGNFRLLDVADRATLLRGKTVVTIGTSSDEVVQRGFRLRAPVPIEELKQWVKGLPGNASQTTTDLEGKLDSLRFIDADQIPWTVRFKRYDSFDGVSLPVLITASGGDYSVRLLLKNWNLDTNSVVSEANQPNKRLSIPSL